MRPTYTVRSGCESWEWPVGNDAVIPIEYEVNGGEVATMESPACHDEIMPLKAFINGEWVDFQDVFGTTQMFDYVVGLIEEARRV